MHLVANKEVFDAELNAIAEAMEVALRGTQTTRERGFQGAALL